MFLYCGGPTIKENKQQMVCVSIDIFVYEQQYLPRMSLPADGHRHGLWNDMLVLWISVETFCGFNCHKNSNLQQTEWFLLFLKRYNARLKVYFC